MNTSSQNLIAALILAVGFTAGAWTLGSQFGRLRDSGVITVKGLAEAEYQASFGTWQVGVSAWGKDYTNALTNNEQNLAILKKFLIEQGFDEKHIQMDELDVSPHSETYTDAHGNEKTRQNGYDAVRHLTITTKSLDKLSKSLSAIQPLRAENETIIFGSPKYYLEDLETIKRTLIAQATQDAAVRAEEFAKTSRAKVGAMQSASQGSFDIKSANPDDSDDSDSYGGSYDTSTIAKKVRLVVTIQYKIQ